MEIIKTYFENWLGIKLVFAGLVVLIFGVYSLTINKLLAGVIVFVLGAVLIILAIKLFIKRGFRR